MNIFPKFGSTIPFAEPSWYQGLPTPYFTENHVQFRKFVEEEVRPFHEEWIEKKYFPKHIHKRLYELGLTSIMFPQEYGGTPCADYSIFYELILVDELARVTGGYMDQFGINSFALPPIMNYANEDLKKLIIPQVIKGEKNICLAITEPTAGSDVANIRTTAVKQGDYYLVNGSKKWITGGMLGDYMTTAVRTGGEGMLGISLIVIDSKAPGVAIRPMPTQFDSVVNTTFVTFDNVKVPIKNLLGEEGMGFMYVVQNFNHERFQIAASTLRYARLCYEEAFSHALSRKTFNKNLISHQTIRMKLAEMARLIEQLQDQVEKCAFMFSQNANPHALGQYCALTKVSASRTYEFCAREASQIFGGMSIVKEGKGKIVERLYRDVRRQAIPGGSEEILLDFTIRMAERQARKNQAKL